MLPETHHWITNVTVDFTGMDSASGEAHVITYGRDISGAEGFLSAVYRNQYERRDGVWKATSIALEIQWFKQVEFGDPQTAVAPPSFYNNGECGTMTSDATVGLGDARVRRAFQRGHPLFAVERVNLWRRMPVDQYVIDFRRSLYRLDPLLPIMGTLSGLGAAVFAWNSEGRAAVLAWIGIALIAVIMVGSIVCRADEFEVSAASRGPSARRAERLRITWRRFTGPAPSWRWAHLPVWRPPRHLTHPGPRPHGWRLDLAATPTASVPAGTAFGAQPTSSTCAQELGRLPCKPPRMDCRRQRSTTLRLRQLI